MQSGNPNRVANPYAPTFYDKQPSGQNPYGYGVQRTAGQLAPQSPAQGYNLNSLPPAQQPQAAPTGVQQGSYQYQYQPAAQPFTGYTMADLGNPQFMGADRMGRYAEQAGRYAVNGQPLGPNQDMGGVDAAYAEFNRLMLGYQQGLVPLAQLQQAYMAVQQAQPQTGISMGAQQRGPVGY